MHRAVQTHENQHGAMMPPRIAPASFRWRNVLPLYLKRLQQVRGQVIGLQPFGRDAV
jgi:hypothetical protein